jgi:hypothetical protein
VSVCLSEYYWLSPYLCPHVTCCIGMSVRILQVVSVFLSAYYTLFPYFCPHLRVVSVCPSEYYKLYLYVCLSAYYKFYPYFCTHITGCVPYFFPHLHVVYVCLAECYRLYLYACLSAYYRLFPYFCPYLHVVSMCLSEYYRLYLYVCLSAYYWLYAYICVLLAVFFLHAQNCFHLYACPQITGTALCILQAPITSLRTVQALSCVSAYFRLQCLVKALIASAIVTSVTHRGRQLIPVLYTTVYHFVYQILKLPVVKRSSNEHCALQERVNKQIN